MNEIKYPLTQSQTVFEENVFEEAKSSPVIAYSKHDWVLSSRRIHAKRAPFWFRCAHHKIAFARANGSQTEHIEGRQILFRPSPGKRER